MVSEKAQAALLWWGLLFMFIFGFTLWGLLKMMPPPDATLSAAEVAAFYQQNGVGIRIGAMITSWTSAFMVPYSVVAAIQVARLERGTPVWGIAAFAGGILMSLFLVFPPICWGVAAFTPDRPAEVTALMHEFGLLILVTTDQYYIFLMVAIGYVSLSRQQGPDSAFPRWLGYLTLWAALLFEVGALAFNFKTGPFSWNGALVFWMPLIVFGFWVTVSSAVILRALKRQAAVAVPGMPGNA